MKARDAFYRGRAIAARLREQFADDAKLPKRLAAFPKRTVTNRCLPIWIYEYTP